MNSSSFFRQTTFVTKCISCKSQIFFLFLMTAMKSTNNGDDYENDEKHDGDNDESDETNDGE